MQRLFSVKEDLEKNLYIIKKKAKFYSSFIIYSLGFSLDGIFIFLLVTNSRSLTLTESKNGLSRKGP